MTFEMLISTIKLLFIIHYSIMFIRTDYQDDIFNKDFASCLYKYAQEKNLLAKTLSMLCTKAEKFADIVKNYKSEYETVLMDCIDQDFNLIFESLEARKNNMLADVYKANKKNKNNWLLNKEIDDINNQYFADKKLYEDIQFKMICHYFWY